LYYNQRSWRGVRSVGFVDALRAGRRTGEAASAIIIGIANVALEVRRGDGSRYWAVSRFGFRTPARRAQIGYADAQVPVRVDPADPARVDLDRDTCRCRRIRSAA
jgi:hypothetical protein